KRAGRRAAGHPLLPLGARGEVRRGLGHPPPPFPGGWVVVAVCLGITLVLGCLNNLLVLLIFLKFESIRTPINLILLNISLSDLLVCIFGTPFSLAASVRGRWLLGDAGCKWYGFANALFGRCGCPAPPRN
uniref:G-protein coupled receptors family 1 profile domain-containing protein n=1 Tax=Terrapene triunguis TaxID=2587831 RepID=A0A674KH56_9SAUR